MAVTGRYCLKQINRAEGRDLRLDVSKLYRISSVGPWSMSFDMRETARRNFLLSRMACFGTETYTRSAGTFFSGTR
jgi:hypothetical protein